MTYTYDKQVLTSLVLASVHLGAPKDKNRDTVWQYIFHTSVIHSFHTLWYHQCLFFSARTIKRGDQLSHFNKSQLSTIQLSLLNSH